MGPFLVSTFILVFLTVLAVILFKKSFFKKRHKHELFTDEVNEFDEALLTKDPHIDIFRNRRYFSAISGFITMVFIVIFVEYPTIMRELEEKLDPKAVMSQTQEIEITEQEPPKIKMKQNKPRREEIVEEEIEIDSTDVEELQEIEIVFSDEEEDDDDEEVYVPPIVERAEIRAEFPGGNRAFMKWAYNNLKIPEEDKQKGVRGMIMIQFVVYEDGFVRDIEIVRGISAGLDKAVVKLLKSSPRWTPGKTQGQKVRERWRYPIKITPK
jgi:protein TonB